MFFRKFLASHAPAVVILIRLMLGGVFLSEGLQKFVYPDALGVGRFSTIGIPAPEVMAPFVGVCEIGCGILFLLGLLTRLAAIPMIIDMLVGPRGTHRLLHVAGGDISPRRRGGAVVFRCDNG